MVVASEANENNDDKSLSKKGESSLQEQGVGFEEEEEEEEELVLESRISKALTERTN